MAFALAGTVDIDVYKEPIGKGSDGKPVYLKDIWPSQKEISDTVNRVLNPEMFRAQYEHVFEGDETWKTLDVPEGNLYKWDKNSTYIQNPTFFEEFSLDVPGSERHQGGVCARAAGRFHNDRPHIPRGLHTEGRPRREIPDSLTASSPGISTASGPGEATTRS